MREDKTNHNKTHAVVESIVFTVFTVGLLVLPGIYVFNGNDVFDTAFFPWFVCSCVLIMACLGIITAHVILNCKKSATKKARFLYVALIIIYTLAVFVSIFCWFFYIGSVG